MRLGTLLSIISVSAALKCRTTASEIPVPPSSTEYKFVQPVDHFGLNNNKWEQTYLVNATFYKPGGPIFMSTPGESAISAGIVDSTYITSLAERANGIVVSMEHRFYGESNPMPDLSGSSLKYLTVENVLEDFASFLRVAKSSPSDVFPVHVSPNSDVIFFGVSYAGNVAALMRAVHPELVHGAWASSAVVNSTLEFYQYDQGVGRSIAASGCKDEFLQAVEDLDDILLSGNTTAIADVQKAFGIPQLSAKDFAAMVSWVIEGFALYSVKADRNLVSSEVCGYFDDRRSPLESYADIVATAIEHFGYTPDFITRAGNSSVGINDYQLGQADRTWYYQTCAWFADWHVAPPQNTGLRSFRSKLVDLDYYQRNCAKKFGKGIKVPTDTNSYNRKWFYPLLGAKRIYYTSGTLDPWHDSTVVASNLFVNRNTDKSPIVAIHGASHGQELTVRSSNDLPSVIEARDFGTKLVLDWLS